MGTGLIACFDEESAKRLKELWRILTDSPDLHGRIFEEEVPPHITLFGHEDDIRKQEFYDALESAISKYNSFSLNFTGLTTFPATQVLYLNPEYSSNLQSLRKLCLETLENQGAILDQEPDSTWNPHVTLLLDLPTQEISKAVEISQNYLDLQITKPFVVKISHFHESHPRCHLVSPITQLFCGERTSFQLYREDKRIIRYGISLRQMVSQSVNQDNFEKSPLPWIILELEGLIEGSHVDSMYYRAFDPKLLLGLPMFPNIVFSKIEDCWNILD